MQGNHVASLLNTELAPGEYQVEWNGTSDNNKECTPGIYFASIIYNKQKTFTKKILLE